MNRPLIALWTLFGSWFIGGFIGYLTGVHGAILLGGIVGMFVWFMVFATLACLDN
jgi:hypothetical protein